MDVTALVYGITVCVFAPLFYLLQWHSISTLFGAVMAMEMGKKIAGFAVHRVSVERQYTRA